MTWSKIFFSHYCIIFKHNKILKLNDVYKFELAKFMHKLFFMVPDNNISFLYKSGQLFTILFCINQGNYNNYLLPRVDKTTGQNTLTTVLKRFELNSKQSNSNDTKILPSVFISLFFAHEAKLQVLKFEFIQIKLK